MEKTFGVSQFMPPPSPAPDSKSFLALYFLPQLLYSFHGLHSTPAVTFGEWCWRLCPVSPQQREILPVPPVDIHELLCWWSQLRGWRLTGSFSSAWQWGFSRQNWGVFSVDHVGKGEKGWGTVQLYHCWLCSLNFWRKVLDLKGDVCVCVRVHVRCMHTWGMLYFGGGQRQGYITEWEFDKNPNLDISRLN